MLADMSPLTKQILILTIAIVVLGVTGLAVVSGTTIELDRLWPAIGTFISGLFAGLGLKR
jgi:hypothetical protein